MTTDRENREYFDLVYARLLTTRREWRLYRSLFGTNKETVDFLNSALGPTTGLIQDLLFERTLLGIRTLTEPNTRSRRSNEAVSITGLISRFHADACDVKRYVKNAATKSNFAKTWSDKNIAHADLEYEQNAELLPGVSRKMIDEALDAIAEVVRLVSKQHFDESISTHILLDKDDGRALLKVLYEGQKAIAIKKEEFSKAIENGLESNYIDLEQRLFAYPDWLDREDPPFDK